MRKLLVDIFLRVFLPKTFAELTRLRNMRARLRRSRTPFSGNLYDADFEFSYSRDDPAIP
jgi:hypothetical protein